MLSRIVRPVFVCVFALALATFVIPSTCSAEEIAIDVAPNILNIQSDGKVVTVHTDVAYSAVDVSTVYLNGVAISSWKADNRGNFVAKFLMDEIKTLDGLIIGDYNLLKIVGQRTSDETFWGEQEIMVIDRGSSRSSEPRASDSENS